MSILTITARHIYRLRGAGGEAFLEFCDALLRAELSRRGMPATTIATNQRSTKPDGGVDTRVDVTVPETFAGWLTSPTSWQYKGTDASGALGEAALREEIQKEYSVELLRRGYAYRFAICDDVPAEKREAVDAFLTAEARAINPEAPLARLVTAGDLASWGSQYPALLVRFFGSELGNLLSMHSWKPNITGNTPTYVPLQSQSEIFSALQIHAALDREPNRVEMVIEGEPGIGKTRLVYEALANARAEPLVLYTNDEQIATIAASVLANSSSAAILVADECSPLTRVRMVATLTGHRSRVRLISIDAPTERSPFDSDQPWLSKMSNEDVDRILNANFPEVSGDHRSAYRDLARGYIRLAIDLCQQDTLITERGLGVALRSVDDYMTTRLSDSQLEAAMAVSLFHRVGFRDDITAELAAAAKLLSLSLDQLHQELRTIRNGPGFVAEAGRYYYVTPAIVAEALFARAWTKWAAGREASFLNSAGALPKELFDSFLKRVSINAPVEVRRIVGEHFLKFLSAITGASLRDDEVVRRLAVLIEARPQNVSFLRSAIEKASDEDVQAISGAYGRGWGPRRTLVWLAEHLARYPEFFHDAEAILWRLGANENETAGNNATEIWRQLFRVYLSGSALPIAERLGVLKHRLEIARGSEVSLAIGAFRGIFSDWMSRTGGTVYIGGRLAPDDWQPQTYGELGDAYKEALALLRRELTSPDDERRALAKEALVNGFWFLLTKGYLPQTIELIEVAQLERSKLLDLIGHARDYLSREATSDIPEEQEYLASVTSWIEACLGGDLRRPFLEYLTKEPPYTQKDAEFRASARSAARAFMAAPDEFREHIELASGSNPYRSVVLGGELGRLDTAGALFRPLLDAFQRSSRSSLIGGYVQARSSESHDFVEVLNRTIDTLAETSPHLAAELSNASPRETHALDRTLSAVSSGVLAPAYLKRFVFGVQGEPLTVGELSDVLRVLSSHRDPAARSVAMELLGYLVKGNAVQRASVLSEGVRLLAWEVVESLEEGTLAYSWADVVGALAETDHERATRLAIRAMVQGDFYLNQYAERLAVNLAAQDVPQALQIFGEALREDGASARFLLNRYPTFVKSLPFHLTANWLQTMPIETVRRFARNLERPHLSADGSPVVPPLTEYVLREFEDDDDVFENFYSGTHHLRTYNGDISRQHAAEAEIAKRFRNHTLRRIREWAEMETARGTRWAEMWSQRNAEERSEGF